MGSDLQGPLLELAKRLEDGHELTWDEVYDRLIEFADEQDEYSGVPLPVDGYAMTLAQRAFPDREFMEETLDLTKAGLERKKLRRENVHLSDEELNERLVEQLTPLVESAQSNEKRVTRNTWYSSRLGQYIHIVEQGGKFHLEYSSGSFASDRITYLLATMATARIYDIRAERRAMEKLRELIGDARADMYETVGGFAEDSKRSPCTYIFRRAKPTLAFGNGVRRVLCALCMHPLGYYQGTHSGAMVPTDDVIAHLLMMRGDEHRLWRSANQHPVWLAEAGI